MENPSAHMDCSTKLQQNRAPPKYLSALVARQKNIEPDFRLEQTAKFAAKLKADATEKAHRRVEEELARIEQGRKRNSVRLEDLALRQAKDDLSKVAAAAVSNEDKLAARRLKKQTGASRATRQRFAARLKAQYNIRPYSNPPKLFCTRPLFFL